MNRFQDPIQLIDVTLTSLHPDSDYFPFGRHGALFFWYRRGKNPLKGFEIAPESQGAPGGGYERVRINIHELEQQGLILWCKRGGSESPIVDLRLGKADTPPGEGFECTKQALLDDVHVWYKTQEASRALRDFDSIFYEGARFDVKDGRVWRSATVIALNQDNIRVSFDGWSKKWDETFSKNDPRIAPLYSMTNGHWRGPSQTVRPGFLLLQVWDEFEDCLRGVERCVLKLSDREALSEQEVDLLLSGQYFWHLRNALHCDLGSEEAVERSETVQKYIQTYLQLVVVVLSHLECNVQPHWFNVAVLALGGDPRNCGLFYSNYGFHKPRVQGNFATSRNISSYLAENIDFFGSQKGFDYVVRRLDPEAKTSFTTSASILQFIQSILPHLSQGFTESLLQRLNLRDAFLGMIRNITEDELRRYEQPVIMEKVKRMATGLLVRRTPGEDKEDAEVGRFLEECEMELLNSVIRIGVFKQKMQAMEHLGKVIEAVVPPQYKRYLTGEDPSQPTGSYRLVRDAYGGQVRRWIPDPLPPPPAVKHLTMDWLVDWILGNRIVERMLGEDSHEQLIRRTAPVLKFLAQRKQVTEEHIQLLWDAHAGAGESTIRIVQETLSDLAQELSRKHLAFLFSRIKQKPLNKYKDYDMHFLKQFTISALKSPESVLSRPSSPVTEKEVEAVGESDEKEPNLEKGVLELTGQLQGLALEEDEEDDYYGMDLFWQMLLLPELRMELRNQAFDILKDLLRETALEPRRAIYTRKCIRVLKHTLDTAQPTGSMAYILRLLIHVVAVGHPEDVAQTIQQQDQEFDLINLVLRNAVLHAKHINSDIRQRAESSQLTQDVLTQLRKAHSEELGTYMEFIRESIQYSALVLRTSHIELLWEAMVEHAAQAEDTQLLFRELSSAILNPDHYFDEEAVKAIFQRLATADVAARVLDPGAPEERILVGLEWFRCFQKFFLVVNSHRGGLTSPVRARFLTKTLGGLEGFESLWKFACEAADPLVSQSGRNFLVLLFIRLDPELPAEELKSSFRQFVELSMSRLSIAARELKTADQSESSQVREVGQVVSLIDTLLSQVQRMELAVRPLFQKGERVKAWWRTNKRNIMYDAQVVQVNPNGTYAVHYADNDRDSQCPEHNLFNLDGTRRVQKVLDPEIRDLPQELLASSDEYFELFFQLLGLGGETAQLVWELLSTLPTNQTLLRKMQSLTTVPEGTPIDWSEFLPGDSFIKLLYTLGIVRSLIRFPQLDISVASHLSSGDEDDLVAAAQELTPVNIAWRRMFLERHGFAHLYQAFLSMSDQDIVSGPLPKKSVVSILQLLKHFLLDPPEATAVPRETARAGIDFAQLLQRLLSCLHAVSSHPLPEHAPEKVVEGHVVLLRQCGSLIVSILGLPVPSGGAEDRLSEAVYSFPHWNDILFHSFLKRQKKQAVDELQEQVSLIWDELKLRQLGGLPSLSTSPTQMDVVQSGSDSENPQPEEVDEDRELQALMGDLEDPFNVEFEAKQDAPTKQKSRFHHHSGEDDDDDHGDDGTRILVGKESPMHSFFVPRILNFLTDLDPNAPDMDIGSLGLAVGHLLGEFLITPEVMDVQPIAEALTRLVRTQPFEEDSNVTDEVMMELLGLARNLVNALPQPARFLFGIGRGSSSPPTTEDQESGGALRDDPDILNAINAITGAEVLSDANQSTGGSGLVVDLVRYLFDIPRNTSSSATTSAGNSRMLSDLPPKFKAKPTRTAAFNLLRSICQGSDRDSLVVVRGLMPNHLVTADNDTFDEDWNYTFREYEVKRRGAYVGLRNLGCICYMNSSLQQLFMIPKLRQSILSIDTEAVERKSAEENRETGVQDKHSGVIYQLQHLFANLQESTETYVNPKNLTDIWIGDDGRPINVGKQEDSADFVNTLIDRINEKLKGTKQESLLTSVLRGQIADQIFGRGGCPHYREHTQPFSVLPVEIKGKKNLKEALDGFVEGELMAGDNKVNCEQCGKKQAVYKRQALKQLPEVLCINLKRFALDYESFETEKINARLEFPMELDMRPYTIENMSVPDEDDINSSAGSGGGEEGKASGEDSTVDDEEDDGGAGGDEVEEAAEPKTLPDDHYKYVLRGVVIHTGDVNRGHYYSYIQERSKDPNTPGKWYCFNDHSVQSFDPKHLGPLAFGGENSSTGHANAYLLFYDRVSAAQSLAEDSADNDSSEEEEAKDGTENVFSSDPEKAGEPGYEMVSSLPVTTGTEEEQKEAPKVASAKVPKDIFRDIWQQNITTARDKLVYDPDYFDFLADFLGQIAEDFPAHPVFHPRPVDLRTLDLRVPVDLRDAAARLAARFLIKSLARCTHKKQLNPLGDAIWKLFQSNVTASAWIMWMMVVEHRWAEDFMLEAPWDDIRKNIGRMLCAAVSQVTPLETEVLQAITQNRFPEWPGVDKDALGVPDNMHIADLPHVHKSEADQLLAAGWDTEPTPDGKAARRDALSPPAPKGYAANFFDVLLRILPAMLPKWYWNFDYFKIWGKLLTSSEAMTAYAVQQGAITHLMDVWLGNESPHPVVEISRDHTGRRLEMRGKQNAVHTNLDSFWIALGEMVDFNVRKTGLPWGENEMDEDMLTHPTVLRWLPFESSTFERGAVVRKILPPLVRESSERSAVIANQVREYLRGADFDVLRPVFRWLPSYLAVQDSLQRDRVQFIMTGITETVNLLLQHFWKDSDFYIAHLIRLARVSPEARDWLRERPEQIQTFIDWLQTFPDPESLDQPGVQHNLQRFRKRPRQLNLKYRDWFEVNTLTSPWSGPQDMSAEEKIAALRALLLPDDQPGALELDPEGYDSDSESWKEDWHIGDLVDARDYSMDWREARVTNKLGNSIHVKYSSDFYEEWIKLRQFRLAPRGTFSHLTPQREHFNYYRHY